MTGNASAFPLPVASLAALWLSLTLVSARGTPASAETRLLQQQQDAASEKSLVWDFFQQRPSGFFVDVGANDPRKGSQTWHLEQQGWTGILIEPLERFQAVLRAARPRSRVVRAACGPPGHPPSVEFLEAENPAHSGLRPDAVKAGINYVGREEVPMFTLDEVLEQAGGPRVDFVSIDVEGFQVDVLRGFDLARHRPALVLIEDHLLDWRTHFHLRRSGYRLARRTMLNSWYVPRDHPFRPTLKERLKLWRKVWPGTPVRRLKFEFRRWRAGQAG